MEYAGLVAVQKQTVIEAVQYQSYCNCAMLNSYSIYIMSRKSKSNFETNWNSEMIFKNYKK